MTVCFKTIDTHFGCNLGQMTASSWGQQAPRVIHHRKHQEFVGPKWDDLDVDNNLVALQE